MDTNYQDFANAIIIQAIKDYRLARQKLRKEPGHPAALRTLEEVERFFRSAWYGCLTRVPAERLLERLGKEAM